MKVLRTDEARFVDLPGFPWEPKWSEVDGLRIARVDEGPLDAPPVLLLHGEPTWSYLYRHMIPPLLEAGHRVVAPDLVGFGRSDKPASPQDYSYAKLVAWMSAWLEELDLREVTLVCQDWGSLVGLRLVAAMPDRFARVVVANGGLPIGRPFGSRAFTLWRAFARWSPLFPIGRIVDAGCTTQLSPAVRAAYDAPFPSARYKSAARVLPSLVPTSPDDPETGPNLAAWSVLEQFEKPFLTAFSNRDPITRGMDKVLQARIPGAARRTHPTIRGGGHFLQEDCGPALASVVNAFIDET